MYGVNYNGGKFGYGTIFKLTTAGVYTVLKSFDYKPDGANSYGGLIQAKDGNLYGMTYWGGTNGFGVIFKITTAGVYTVLKHFASATDGAYPRGDLLQATDGLLYGVTPTAEPMVTEPFSRSLLQVYLHVSKLYPPLLKVAVQQEV